MEPDLTDYEQIFEIYHSNSSDKIRISSCAHPKMAKASDYARVIKALIAISLDKFRECDQFDALNVFKRDLEDLIKSYMGDGEVPTVTKLS